MSFTYFVSRSIGLGLLCLPYAFKQVGMFIGLVLCFITGLMFTYSFTTLVSTQMFSVESHYGKLHSYKIQDVGLTSGLTSLTCV